MRKFSFFLLALLLVVSITVYAHPGRTDGSGGHTNHSTGEYHYHHGYSEHQHYDMDGDGIADCPYDFKDNTAKVDKDSSSKNNTAKVQKDKEQSNKNNTFTDEYNDLRQQQSKSEIHGDVTTEKTSNDAEQKSSDKEKPTTKKIIGTILAIIMFGPLMFLWALSIISAVLSGVCDFIQKLKKK